MTETKELLIDAINKRVAGYGKDIWVFVALGFLAVACGGTLFYFLWHEFRDDKSPLISQLASGATTLVTAGIGGALLTKVVSLREEIREGNEWRSLYQSALGPPPHNLIPEIQEKILSWLEG